jgi:glycosyltransferase involved in cell wall biosynthesis
MNIGFEAKRAFHNRTGLGNYSRDVVRILSSHFPDNNYFLYNPKPSGLYKKVASPDNVHEVLPRTKFDRFFKNLWRQKRVQNEFSRDNIDVFHGLSGEVPSIKKNSVKVVVTVHDLIFLRYPKFYSLFDRLVHKMKVKKACNRADVVIAVSEQTKKDIIGFLHISPEKVKVVYQGCMDVFKKHYSASEVNETRIKHKLPLKYLLSVGTVEERKNILSAIKAIQGSDYHLAVVGGETKYTQTVKAYIAQNKMESQVHFLKNVSSSELAMLYQGAELMIYPSLFEGFGIPIIESLYMKTPVITSKDGCFSEAAGPGALYVNPQNVEEISQAVDKLMGSHEMRDKLAGAGYEYVQRFNEDYIAREMMGVYAGLVKHL